MNYQTPPTDGIGRLRWDLGREIQDATDGRHAYVIHELGSVCVRVHVEPDNDDPQCDHLGEYSKYREPRTREQKLVHLGTRTVLDHHGIWRDELGRIAPTPEEREHSREYQYTWHDNGHERVKYALQDSDRLVDLNNGGWCYLGVVVRVTIGDQEVGCASIWGVESDSDPEYLGEVARDMAHEALREARGEARTRVDTLSKAVSHA